MRPEIFDIPLFVLTCSTTYVSNLIIALAVNVAGLSDRPAVTAAAAVTIGAALGVALVHVENSNPASLEKLVTEHIFL